MAAQVIGTVRSESGKTYHVKWDPVSKDTYVAYAGWSNCGKASSPGDAMRNAEAFLYDK